MKEFQKKGLIMYENTAITVEYIVFKINMLSKSIEELEQLEKYIIDEEKVMHRYIVINNKHVLNTLLSYINLYSSFFP